MPTSDREDVSCLLRRAAAILADGGLVAYPTDTVFGLGAAAFNAQAVRRVFRAKRRVADTPLPLILSDARDVWTVAKAFPECAQRLAEAFWPGPLTLVLPSNNNVPLEITAGTGAVGVRVPAHETPVALVRRLGQPMTGTSANASGARPHADAASVAADLGDAVDLVLPGRCGVPGSLPSTVVAVTGAAPRVLRVGALPLSRVLQICPEAERALPAGLARRVQNVS